MPTSKTGWLADDTPFHHAMAGAGLIPERSARWLLRRIARGSLTIRAFGAEESVGQGEPSAILDIRDDRFWRALLQGSKGLGLAYGERWWDTDDLTAALRVGSLNLDRLEPLRRTGERTRMLARPFAPLRRNDPTQDRANIAAHYDTGNAFFALFLDESMTYSSAIFDPPGSDLATAQRTKIDRLCQKLELGPDDRLLEIGTGWGALAIHAAKNYGCHVTTTTISAEQYDHARSTVGKLGLEQNIEVIDQHWRDVNGRFDKLVSVEMIEAVDWRELGTFLAKCSDLLEPHGLMALQAIVITDQRYDRAKRSNDFIRDQIFPGGCLPSVAALLDSTRQSTDLGLIDLIDIGAHYATTVRTWRENLLGASSAAQELGFDDRSLRLWQFYFAYCEAAFLERRISDVQMLFAKPDWRAST